MRRKYLFAALLVSGIFTSAPCGAVDGIAFEAGGGDGADMARVALQWDWKKRWLQGSGWHVGGYWDLGIGYWRWRNDIPSENRELMEIGLTPVFRIQSNDLRGLYGEVAIGVHVLSETSLGDKRFSTQFQFGDHLGVGYRFGDRGRYELSLRFQHLSNGRIKTPNDGTNFSQIRYQYRF